MSKLTVNAFDLDDEEAQDELRKFTKLALPFSIICFFVLGFLGCIGTGYGTRAFLLTFHKGNENNPKLWGYRIINALVAVLGLFDLVAWLVIQHGRI